MRRLMSLQMFSFLVFSLAAVAVWAEWKITLDVSVTGQAQQKEEGRSIWQQGRPLTPAGELVLDATTQQPAVGALPVTFARSPDKTGPSGKGRYLIVVNSGYGLQFNTATRNASQSLAVMDLNLQPAAVVQNIYFPAPQSAHVGAVFSPQPDATGAWTLYVSGGVENKIWIFRLRLGQRDPLTPGNASATTPVTAPFISVAGFAQQANSPRYNRNLEPVYPMGLAISDDGELLYTANNLGDSLGVVSELRSTRPLRTHTIGIPGGGNPYPYEVMAMPLHSPGARGKVFVSLWGAGALGVMDPSQAGGVVRMVKVGGHPTAMARNEAGTRLYVVNSNEDSVSVIDTRAEREIERISVKLSEGKPIGASPEGLALSEDEKTLYVANAHAGAIAVVNLSGEARGVDGKEVKEVKEVKEIEEVKEKRQNKDFAEGTEAQRTLRREEAEKGAEEREEREEGEERSVVRGFIPTGSYPSAIVVVGKTIYVGNGKGTGFENSSVIANRSGISPNAPNDRFPIGAGRGGGQGGQYILSLISGNISAIAEPDDLQLAAYTQQAMRNVGLIGQVKQQLFKGASPIKHIIYVIRENRTYDQVYGDLEKAGNGQKADGDPRLAIFGAGTAAQRPGADSRQSITPNARTLALRFGLFDRFFVNSEASPDGHNWSTAAFSTDYTDKAYRWNYSSRGRTYDFEGFNRLPNTDPMTNEPPILPTPAKAVDIANFMKRFIPYLNSGRDIAEPETLYLWDAAARAKLSYRNYGEFVATISQSDLDAFNANRAKRYPDVSPTIEAFPTKKSLEGNHSATFRNFDMETPDALTTDCYRAMKSGKISPPMVVPEHADARCKGYSRIADWLGEFRGYASEREAGRGDRLPNFTMMKLPNDHTSGLAQGSPTPQFYVAESDYALGLLVEAVSNSVYWKDTAIFVLEDDAQDGPDHVDAHRSPALVISAYNRPGVLVHEFHNTVSLIRAMELLLGMEPMNLLDANAVPMDIFQETPDLRPYKAVLPDVAMNNLINPSARDTATAYWIKKTEEQNLAHADMADPRVLNEIIWFSVRGGKSPMPEIARLPAFDAMRAGMLEEAEEHLDVIKRMRTILARRDQKKMITDDYK
jgi:YVTN family beta-propeller protein